MDKVLADGDLDDITAMVTAHKLTKCKTNSLEKSLEVCTNYCVIYDIVDMKNKNDEGKLEDGVVDGDLMNLNLNLFTGSPLSLSQMIIF